MGLVGLNGHGKSTLLQAIVGLTGWQAGSIKLDGTEIEGPPRYGAGRRTASIVKRGVSLAPQGDHFPGLTVRENLDSGAHTGKAWRERKIRRDRVLEIFPPLAKLLGQSVGTLSGGERRMVSLGRAFAKRADRLPGRRAFARPRAEDLQERRRGADAHRHRQRRT